MRVLLPLVYFFNMAAAFVLVPPTRKALQHKHYFMCLENEVIKLPIVQLVRDNVIEGEFIMGNDLERSTRMLEAAVGAEMSKYDDDEAAVAVAIAQQSNNRRGHGVDNVYSDDQLSDIFARGDLFTVLELYKDGCKKCAAFEPVFYELARKTKFPEGCVKWARADAENVPVYAREVVERLVGSGGSGDRGIHATSATTDDDYDDKDCATCQNCGFVKCSECAGEGVVKRAAAGGYQYPPGGSAGNHYPPDGAAAADTYTVYCPTCVGYKKVRCPSCGGRCVKCAV
jgi:hypothetical protein